jgi:hypothetical protein
MEPLILLIIFLANLAFLYFSRNGVLFNIFAVLVNLVAFFECTTWFEFFFISMFSILQSIIIVEKLGG